MLLGLHQVALDVSEDQQLQMKRSYSLPKQWLLYTNGGPINYCLLGYTDYDGPSDFIAGHWRRGENQITGIETKSHWIKQLLKGCK